MWSYLAFLFLCGVLGGSLWSAPVYCFSRWFRQAKPSWANALDVILAVSSVILNLNMVFVLPVCIAGAMTERSKESRPRPFFFYLARMLSSTMLPLGLLGVAWLLFMPSPTLSALSILSDKYLATDLDFISFWAGVFVGLALVPAGWAIYSNAPVQKEVLST